MATQEDKETLRLLVQHVSRAFYEPKFTIILDQLARHPVLKDDDLAGRMGLQPKELNKVIAVLHNDSLVRIYRQNELKEGAQRAVGRAYYYIDYEHFCNVVKWRITKMHRTIDSTLRNEIENKGYICNRCKAAYSPLDIDKIMDRLQGILVCEICQGEVVDHDDAETLQGSKDLMKRFHHAMRFIRAGLQKSESMILPAFDVAVWVKTHLTDPHNKEESQADGLKVAGADGSTTKDDGIAIVMSTDKDEVTRRMERDAEAEAKRVQNALPAWHLKSTISGDLTALGIKESARAEAAASASLAASSSGDDILSGLGVIGASKPTQQEQSMPMMAPTEDVKPVINQEADYYDRYYASLAASASASNMPSAQTTPSSYALPEFGFDDEEEDKKPNVEYLDSLNDYRKRSRSREDVGNDAHATKVAKVNGYSLPLSADINGFGSASGVSGVSRAVEEPAPEPEPMVEDDPIVYVNGEAREYSKVTEEDHELMTIDEYTAFFEIMQSRS